MRGLAVPHHPRLQLDRLRDHRRERLRHVRSVHASARSATSTATTPKAVLFQGSALGTQARARTCPRLAAAPLGRPELHHRRLHAADARLRPARSGTRRARCFDIGRDRRVRQRLEVDVTDRDFDDGRDVRRRFSNDVYGLRFGIQPGRLLDFRGPAYLLRRQVRTRSSARPPSFWHLRLPPGARRRHRRRGVQGQRRLQRSVHHRPVASTCEVLRHRRRLRLGPGGPPRGGRAADRGPGRRTGPSPDPTTAAFGVFTGNPTRIGYGGWDGEAQQVATINVDNEFTDFDEPMAESVIGWKGITVVPTWSRSATSNSRASTRYIDYNTNWQAWGDDTLPLETTTSIPNTSRTPASGTTTDTPTRRSRTRRRTSSSCAPSTCSTWARASTSSARSR